MLHALVLWFFRSFVVSDCTEESIAVAFYGENVMTYKIHCIGTFVRPHTILTSCTCVGNFTDKNQTYEFHDQSKIHIRDLFFRSYTVVSSHRSYYCLNGDVVVHENFGCWITQEASNSLSKFHEYNIGDQTDCDVLGVKFGDRSQSILKFHQGQYQSASECMPYFEFLKQQYLFKQFSCLIFSHYAYEGAPVKCGGQNVGITMGMRGKSLLWAVFDGRSYCFLNEIADFDEQIGRLRINETVDYVRMSALRLQPSLLLVIFPLKFL